MSTASIRVLTKIKQASTPKLLRWALFGTWGASALLLTMAIAAVQSQREAIKNVGLDTAPSILNAQRIKDSLADMDANAANELIARLGQNQDAVDGYNQRRDKLAKLLVAVAENITYEDEERVPIQTIQAKVGDYFQLIQQARDFHAQGNEASMLKSYRAAADVMDGTLLPAATTLAEVNDRYLNQSYQANRRTAGIFLVGVGLSGVLLLGVLVGLQLFLNRRMRRLLNPGLLAASAICLAFLSYTALTLLTASYHLKVAKEDAFDSLYALRAGRSLSYSANGDESRYLLDRAFAKTHERAFFRKTSQIAQIPSNQTFETVANAYQSTPDASFKFPGFQGFLAAELHNITFAGERAAAVSTVRAFGTYFNIDKQIRQLEQRGKHEAAIALCIGNDPGQSNWAFDQFKDAHQTILDINMVAFQQSIAQAFQDAGVDIAFKINVDPNAQNAQAKAANEAIGILGTTNKVEIHALTRFEIIAISAIAAIAILTLLGLLPRQREYSR